MSLANCIPGQLCQWTKYTRPIFSIFWDGFSITTKPAGMFALGYVQHLDYFIFLTKGIETKELGVWIKILRKDVVGWMVVQDEDLE